MTWLNRTHVGDCRDLLARMAADGVRVQMCVTSPPYYGLRDYQTDGQIGLEPTLSNWVEKMVDVFSLVREILTDDGTLWLNLGDSFASSGRGGKPTEDAQIPRSNIKVPDLAPKNLMGQPWRVALALQDAGWYLRRDIIWHKPNPMPEAAKDRPTTAHEYIFLLSPSERYYYDAGAIAEPVTGGAHARGSGVNPKARFVCSPKWRQKQNASFSAATVNLVQTRNARSVWTIPTEQTSFAHFACFPREIPKRCILAGSKPGDVILDPFMGSGTTAQVATSLGRHFIGCELNPHYVEMQRRYRKSTIGLAL